MSNLPPGVTGREPAIAGYPEGNYKVSECKGYMPDDARTVPLPLIEEILACQEELGAAGTLLDASRVQVKLERLRKEMLEMPVAFDVPCNFEGDVDAQFDGGRTYYTAFWTCPRCGSEQEEDRELGDDHPDL